MLASTVLQAGAVAARPLVRVDGSSTVYPISEAVAEDFQREASGAIWVTVGISGTAGGFRKFCRGELDIVDASRPVTDAERQRCASAGVGFLEIPVALDALTVVVSRANPVRAISLGQLRRLWAPEAQGRIVDWHQLGAEFPARRLALYGPGTDSGTFEYFTAVVVGRPRASRGDYTASEDDNQLVSGVAGDEGALGYFGLAYYLENQDRLRALALVSPQHPEGVEPTVDNIRAGRYQPLSRRLFIYVSVAAAARPEVARYVEYYLHNAARLAAEVGYVPLDDAEYRDARNRLGAVRGGADGRRGGVGP